MTTTTANVTISNDTYTNWYYPTTVTTTGTGGYYYSDPSLDDTIAQGIYLEQTKQDIKKLEEEFKKTIIRSNYRVKERGWMPEEFGRSSYGRNTLIECNCQKKIVITSISGKDYTTSIWSAKFQEGEWLTEKKLKEVGKSISSLKADQFHDKAVGDLITEMLKEDNDS